MELLLLRFRREGRPPELYGSPFSDVLCGSEIIQRLALRSGLRPGDVLGMGHAQRPRRARAVRKEGRLEAEVAHLALRWADDFNGRRWVQARAHPRPHEARHWPGRNMGRDGPGVQACDHQVVGQHRVLHHHYRFVYIL